MNYKILVDEENPVTKDYLNSLNLKEYNGIKVEKKALNAFLSLQKEVSVNLISAYKENNINDPHITGLLLDIDKDINKNILQKYGFIKQDKSIRYVGVSTSKMINDNNLTLKEYNNLYNKSFMLLINKPSGITSFDVCKKVSKIFDTKKVGHTGTLDPLAEGLMLILVNKYTKLNNLIDYDYKEYIAVVQKGIETDTLDITGKVLKEEKVKNLPNLNNILQSFKGKYMQEVPIYSAVKINGKKLYEYARKGKEIDLPKREVEIKNISLMEEKEDTFTFKCLVSKGTYIRSLIRDISIKLNYPLTMKKLLRTKEGKFKIENSTSLDKLNINTNKLYLEDIFDYEIIDIDDNTYNKLINGVKINKDIRNKKLIRYKNKVIGLIHNENGIIKKDFLI